MESKKKKRKQENVHFAVLRSASPSVQPAGAEGIGFAALSQPEGSFHRRFRFLKIRACPGRTEHRSGNEGRNKTTIKRQSMLMQRTRPWAPSKPGGSDRHSLGDSEIPQPISAPALASVVSEPRFPAQKGPILGQGPTRHTFFRSSSLLSVWRRLVWVEIGTPCPEPRLSWSLLLLPSSKEDF